MPKVDKKEFKQFRYDSLCKERQRVKAKVEKAEDELFKLNTRADNNSTLAKLYKKDIKRLEEFTTQNAQTKQLGKLKQGDRGFAALSMGGSYVIGSSTSKAATPSTVKKQSFSLSLARSRDNIQAAWDAILPSVIEYGPSSVSVIDEEKCQQEPTGKEIEIEIPSDMSVDQLEAFLTSIHKALQDAGVKSGPAPSNMNMMPGSAFCGYSPTQSGFRQPALDTMHINPQQMNLSELYHRIHMSTQLFEKLSHQSYVEPQHLQKLQVQYQKVMHESLHVLAVTSPMHQGPLQQALDELEQNRNSALKKQQVFQQKLDALEGFRSQTSLSLADMAQYDVILKGFIASTENRPQLARVHQQYQQERADLARQIIPAWDSSCQQLIQDYQAYIDGNDETMDLKDLNEHADFLAGIDRDMGTKSPQSETLFQRISELKASTRTVQIKRELGRELTNIRSQHDALQAVESEGYKSIIKIEQMVLQYEKLSNALQENCTAHARNLSDAVHRERDHDYMHERADIASDYSFQASKDRQEFLSQANELKAENFQLAMDNLTSAMNCTVNSSQEALQAFKQASIIVREADKFIEAMQNKTNFDTSLLTDLATSTAKAKVDIEQHATAMITELSQQTATLSKELSFENIDTLQSLRFAAGVVSSMVPSDEAEQISKKLLEHQQSLCQTKLQQITDQIAGMKVNSKASAVSVLENYQALQRLNGYGIQQETVKQLMGPGDQPNIHALITQRIESQQKIAATLSEAENPNVNVLMMQALTQSEELNALREFDVDGTLGAMITEACEQQSQQLSDAMELLSRKTDAIIDANDPRELTQHLANFNDLKSVTRDPDSLRQLSDIENKVKSHLANQHRQEFRESPSRAATRPSSSSEPSPDLPQPTRHTR